MTLDRQRRSSAARPLVLLTRACGTVPGTIMNRQLAAILLLAGVAVSLRAQAVRFQVTSGTITILGTSNIHDWKCSTSTLNPTVMVPSSAGMEMGKSVTSISLSIPVKSLECGNGQMNGNLAKALHADEHPAIGFQLVSYVGRAAAAGGYQATVTGSLTINGITRQVTLSGTAHPDGNGALRATGSTSFSTKDFGVEPVKALLGTIKTGEQVTIEATIDWIRAAGRCLRGSAVGRHRRRRNVIRGEASDDTCCYADRTQSHRTPSHADG